METSDSPKSQVLILVPVDYSECAAKAIRYAAKLVAPLNARLLLFHSYYSPALALIEFTGSNYTQAQLQDSVIQDAQAKEDVRMADFIRQICSESGPCEGIRDRMTSEVVPGIAEESILQKIQETNPDLVIMGSKGMGNKEKVFLGSVTEFIINRSAVPVLAIPENYSFAGIENLDNLLYITQFEESDFHSIKQLINLTAALHLRIFCLHLSDHTVGDWDRIKMEGLRAYFGKVYDQINVESAILESTDLLEALDTYVENNGIKVLAITRKKKKQLTHIFKPRLTKQIFYHTNLPLLVFH